jgi:hypothetical protein
LPHQLPRERFEGLGYHLGVMAKFCGGPVSWPATSGMNDMRAIRDIGRVQVGFETPPGKLGLVYDLLTEYGASIVDRQQQCFTLEFQEWDDANDFLHQLFEHRMSLRDYQV